MGSRKRKLILVGQIPPPYHGQSVMIDALAKGLALRMDLVLVPMRFSEEVNDNGNFSFGKVGHLFSLVLRVWGLLIRYPGAVLYYPPAPPKRSTVLRDWVFLALVRPFAGKTLFHFHAYGLGEFLERKDRTGLLSLPYKKPDVAVVLGERCRKDAEIIRAKRICTVPYGIDVNVRKFEEASKDAFRILFVGLHIESKGILDLLNAAAQLRDMGCNFVVHSVGPWKNEQIRFMFEQRRSEFGLESHVICCGELTGDALWAEYAAADVLFFPTFFEFETFGVVVLEAMAYGLPVVVSDWRGPGDVVEDGITGFVCPVHDAGAYAHALQCLLINRELREQMSAAARRRYSDCYRNDCYIEQMEEIFGALGVRR